MKFKATSLKTKKTKQVSKGISKESQPELYNISKAIGTLDLPDPEPVTEENLDFQTLFNLKMLSKEKNKKRIKVFQMKTTLSIQ